MAHIHLAIGEAKMNLTEKRAESWLARNGYANLKFRHGETPDFLTNREPVEVKTICGRNSIHFDSNQIERIKETSAKVLVFMKGKDDPILCQFDELKNYGLRVWVNSRSEKLNVQFKDVEDNAIQKFRQKAQDKFGNRKGAIKKALLEAIGNWVKAN